MVSIASDIRGRLIAGEDVGVKALNLLRMMLGSMGATPSDASRVKMPEEKVDEAPLQSISRLSKSLTGLSRARVYDLEFERGRIAVLSPRRWQRYLPQPFPDIGLSCAMFSREQDTRLSDATALFRIALGMPQ